MARQGKGKGKKLPTFKPIPHPPAPGSDTRSSEHKIYSVHLSESGGIKRRKIDTKVITVNAPVASGSRSPVSVTAPSADASPPTDVPLDHAFDCTPGISLDRSAQATSKPKRVRQNQTVKVSTFMPSRCARRRTSVRRISCQHGYVSDNNLWRRACATKASATSWTYRHV